MGNAEQVVSEAEVSSIAADMQQEQFKGANVIFHESITHHLYFSVVGHIGSGTSLVAKKLENLLNGLGYKAEIIKASDLIREKLSILECDKTTSTVSLLQDEGDRLRSEHGNHILARYFLEKVNKNRAVAINAKAESKCAFIFDSVKHPSEIELLRALYKSSFMSIGIVCDEKTREKRIIGKLTTDSKGANCVMARDSMDDTNKSGQRVSEAFHLSDFFVDNTETEFIESDSDSNKKPNPKWTIDDNLARFIKIISHAQLVRPTLSETGMYHAYGAKLKSACLSRQVGAAIMDSHGEIVATGKNEVPKAGGGTYTDSFNLESISEDHRCAFRDTPHCSSTKEMNVLIDEITQKVVENLNIEIGKNKNNDLNKLNVNDFRDTIYKSVKNTRASGLIEFSRAIHAEMDAILSAQRQGKSVIGNKLFVTTFPCHYCARHIVTAGIDEVFYIEPYPKSLAHELHSDSITSDSLALPSNGGDQVIFKPFVGVAPRLYQYAFIKDRQLKNKETGVMDMGLPEWGSFWNGSKISHIKMEENLIANLP